MGVETVADPHLLLTLRTGIPTHSPETITVVDTVPFISHAGVHGKATLGIFVIFDMANEFNDYMMVV